MHLGSKILWSVVVALIAAAFITKVTVPDKFLFPGGWPVGSHWYHCNSLGFWVLLVLGFTLGIVLAVKSISFTGVR